MKAKSRAYLSRNWKIATPKNIIPLFWEITHQHKKQFYSVLDMGAGDGRLSCGGNYNKYIGVEIDRKIVPNFINPKSSFFYGCVFEHPDNNYSACIGNPPYLRHNEIANSWRDRIINRFKRATDVKLDERSNLYTYFILLGLQKAEPTGLVSLLIPYDWAFLPSSNPIREYIKSNGWSVFLYRFNYLVFEEVLTTASICIINKATTNADWKYFDINNDSIVTEVYSFTESGKLALGYENRGRVWAMRGLSPGSKKIFTLTESERNKFKLSKKDVRPCVTSFKELPIHLKNLDVDNFEKYFISKNKKCWLIKTDKKLTTSLKKYLKKIPKEQRNSWTCLNQKPWYKYRLHPIPKLLMSSAFKESGPRILSNDITAIAVGSVIGIHTASEINISYIHKELQKFDFNSRLIPREQGLKKIAIKQVNAVLNQLVNKNGKQKQ